MTDNRCRESYAGDGAGAAEDGYSRAVQRRVGLGRTK
jgi:hypothetical protein